MSFLRTKKAFTRLRCESLLSLAVPQDQLAKLDPYPRTQFFCVEIPRCPRGLQNVFWAARHLNYTLCLSVVVLTVPQLRVSKIHCYGRRKFDVLPSS